MKETKEKVFSTSLKNELVVVEYNEQRILTTAQIAEAYETDEKIISNNFNRNKERYTQGKHFYCLEGELLKEFKANHQFDERLKFATKLYFWTEKGAFLHAKSLNTDKAWEVYDLLVENYFNVKQQQPVMCVEQAIIESMKLQIQLREQLNQVNNQALSAKAESREAKAEVQAIRDAITLDPAEWRTKTTNLIVKIAQKLGGNEHIQEVRTESYKILEATAKAQLNIRQTNMRRKVLEETGSKSRADKITKLDVIAADARLKEIYISVISKMAIKYGIA